jgi:hypothetical protein
MLDERAKQAVDEPGVFGALFERIDAVMESLDSLLRDNLGPPLKALHEPIDAWLGSLPMSVAMACALGLYAIAVIWVWTLPKEFVFRGAPDQQPWRDLRVWATLVTIPYVIIYMWLGR